MFCPNCGIQITEKSAFCSNCGHQFNNSAVITTSVVEKTKKKKRKHGKVVVAIACIILVIAATAAFATNRLSKKGGSDVVESEYNEGEYNESEENNEKESQWYVAERAITYYDSLSDDLQYKYLDKVQLLEWSVDDRTFTYIYDNNGHLMSVGDSSFSYEQKGGEYVGTSDVYKDEDDDIHYELVKYNRENQLVLQETYLNDCIRFSNKYSYHSNGEISQHIYTYPDGTYYVETFNKNGLIILAESYNADDILIGKAVLEYDGNRINGAKYYDENGELSGIEVLDNKDESSVKIIRYDNENNVEGYSEYIYDEYDHLIEKKEYDEDNKLYRQTVDVWQIMK